MATFVLVHGAWGGSWEWTPVAHALGDRGHRVFRVALTGLGEREHVRSSRVALSDHIEDVQAVLRFEELEDVVLCGHSYAGMVVTGVADRMAERVRLLAYLDAFVPRDGESMHDLLPEEFAAALLDAARERGDGRVPIPDALLPPSAPGDAATERYVARLRPQPIATFTEPVRLTGAVDRVPKAYVECTGYEGSVMGPFADRARSEGWPHRRLRTEHDLQLTDPGGTVEILDEFGGASTRAAA